MIRAAQNLWGTSQIKHSILWEGSCRKELSAVRYKKVHLGIDMQERHLHGYAVKCRLASGEEIWKTMEHRAPNPFICFCILGRIPLFGSLCFLLRCCLVQAGCASLCSSPRRYQAEAAWESERLTLNQHASGRNAGPKRRENKLLLLFLML